MAPPTKLRIEFPHETGLILSCAGKVGPPCRQSRGIDPPVTKWREGWKEGARKEGMKKKKEGTGVVIKH